MPAGQTKGITVKIDASLHAEIKAYLEQNGITMSEFIAQAAQDELHPKIQQMEDMSMKENMRTLAFQVPESLFQRIKDYLQRNGMTQKQFVIGLIEEELDRDEELLHQQEPAQNDMEEEQNEAPAEGVVPEVGPDDGQNEYEPEQEEGQAAGGFEAPADEIVEGQDEGFYEGAVPETGPDDGQSEYDPEQEEGQDVGGFEAPSGEDMEELDEGFSEDVVPEDTPGDGQAEYDPQQEEEQAMGDFEDDFSPYAGDPDFSTEDEEETEEYMDMGM